MPTRRWIALVAALALTSFALVTPPAAAQGATPAPERSLFICIYHAGPAWQAGKPLTAQPLGQHGAYMKKLFEEGRLLAGGPMLDADGGLAIVRAASLEEAKAIFAIDPALTAGVFVGEIHAWRPAFGAGAALTP